MSKYTVCRKCGADLVWNGRSFGVNECCCNNGFCFDCCPEKKPATSAPLRGGGRG